MGGHILQRLHSRPLVPSPLQEKGRLDVGTYSISITHATTRTTRGEYNGELDRNYMCSPLDIIHFAGTNTHNGHTSAALKLPPHTEQHHSEPLRSTLVFRTVPRSRKPKAAPCLISLSTLAINSRGTTSPREVQRFRSHWKTRILSPLFRHRYRAQHLLSLGPTSQSPAIQTYLIVSRLSWKAEGLSPANRISMMVGYSSNAHPALCMHTLDARLRRMVNAIHGLMYF